ncbi:MULTISPECIES: hypothetical protein [unclassified Paraburkholderia]|uniref:hypothetical protein n=1 Tax=unclassified Paraburkholderia TaxID=2615204 RepID=UPI0016090895|nr:MULTISPECIES: hypothetical protein [unclassified Paraburkholderia]MBB5448213.1 hypothetical protein [Paraburkholderia sp. WSM4177]MBB5488612.1 hypothetical protein [Paraburkholderia sp. WSM4180]
MALHTNIGRRQARAGGDAARAGLIFGAESSSNLSHVVQVENDPIVVRAYNLTDGDVVLVEMVDGDGAGRMFAPFCPFDGQSALTARRNVLPIGIPGRYRFVLQRTDGDPPALGLVVVRAHPVAMSHEWLSAYMQCSKG